MSLPRSDPPSVQHATDKIDKNLEGVVEANLSAALAVLTRAVRDLNQTLAVHATWTQERLATVDEHLVSLTSAQGQASTTLEEIKVKVLTAQPANTAVVTGPGTATGRQTETVLGGVCDTDGADDAQR